MKIKKAKTVKLSTINVCPEVCEGCQNLRDTMPYCKLVEKNNPITLNVTMKDHKKDLESFIFRSVKIKQITYNKVEEMAKEVKQQPDQFLDNFINELHKHFFNSIGGNNIQC